MALPRRRLRTTRRLLRPGRPAAPPASAPPSLEILEDLARPSFPEMRSQESTVELPAVQEEIPVPGDRPEAVRVPPKPPPKLEFECPCGRKLVATTEMYDKHLRCALCQTVMLVSLVYDADQRSFEIVPFRINPETGV